MALPNDYKSFDTYFSDAVSFLEEHDFLFNHANTAILSRGVLKKIPNSWTRQISHLTNDEIIALPLSGDNYFDGFFEKLERLLRRNVVDGVSEESVGKISRHLTTGLSPKKQHEIFALCQKIHEQCLLKNVSHILDLGSGLGYLSQLLHEKHGYSILGLEANAQFLKIATERQEKFYKTSSEHVKFEHLYVTERSDIIIKQSVQEAFGCKKKFLIVGLHACGDLAISAVKLFLSLDGCEGICLMPCCYHKISSSLTNESEYVTSYPEIGHFRNGCRNVEGRGCQNNGSRVKLENGTEDNLLQKFDNFPLSDSLKTCFRQFKAEAFLQRPFLRLGCQKPQTSWRNGAGSDYKARVFHLLSRAVLELYAFEEGAKLTKTKRRGVRRIEANKLDFASFLEDAVVRGYVLQKTRGDGTPETTNIELHFDRTKILALWNELSNDDFNTALLFTVMQDSLQGLCENVILLDKLAYLAQHEGRVDNFRFVQVTDERISPRCFALVANKL